LVRRVPDGKLGGSGCQISQAVAIATRLIPAFPHRLQGEMEHRLASMAKRLTRRDLGSAYGMIALRQFESGILQAQQIGKAERPPQPLGGLGGPFTRPRTQLDHVEV
jgi:hypothetical protein